MLSILVNTDAVQVTLQSICLFDKAFQGCVTVLSLPWSRILPGQYKTCSFFFFFFLLFCFCRCVPFLLSSLGGCPEAVNTVAQDTGQKSVRIIILAVRLRSGNKRGKKRALCVEVVQFDCFMTKYYRNGPTNMEQQQLQQRLLHFTIAESQANGTPAADSRSNLRGLCLNSLPLPLRPRVRDSMPTP